MLSMTYATGIIVSGSRRRWLTLRQIAQLVLPWSLERARLFTSPHWAARPLAAALTLSGGTL